MGLLCAGMISAVVSISFRQRRMRTLMRLIECHIADLGPLFHLLARPFNVLIEPTLNLFLRPLVLVHDDSPVTKSNSPASATMPSAVSPSIQPLRSEVPAYSTRLRISRALMCARR